MLSDVNDYKKAIQNGNYALAQSILEANPKIKNTIIDATDINELKHSTMALERMFKEDIELYIESFTNKASDFSAKAATSAENAITAANNALESKNFAQEKAEEANQLVENLRSLKGTLPSDFTEYTQQVANVKNQLDETINTHNTSSSAHEDIRLMIKNSRYVLPPATATTLGGVKLSNDFTTDADGKLHLAGGTAPDPFPVGSIYQSTDPTSPAALFGGSWEEIASERVLMGASSTHAAGTTVEAGLPNITGTLSDIMGTIWASPSGSGAFSGKYIGRSLENGNSGNYSNIFFDASKSNAIYGRSSTVQPAAYYVHIWHRVA